MNKDYQGVVGSERMGQIELSIEMLRKMEETNDNRLSSQHEFLMDVAKILIELKDSISSVKNTLCMR